ncbi:hypothetical protein E3N88_18195 [Mikania micrantha]|uniref:Zinc finger, CCHC-type n=1 Tax=Mikania micrantha TaxID=192012 RepID=A0A5N6NVD4_9ASTR|nr:hypothetical protein E3N88_18195 [Mikania micrantha]
MEAMKMLETETVDEFVGRLSGIQFRYRSLGSSLDEEVLVRKFLNSMPPKYLPIVASIEQDSEIKNIAFEEVVGRLKTYEKRVKPQEDLARDVRDKLLLVHNDKKVKGKKGRCGGYDCCQQNNGKCKWVVRVNKKEIKRGLYGICGTRSVLITNSCIHENEEKQEDKNY